MLLWNHHRCEQKLWKKRGVLDYILLTFTCITRNHGFLKGWNWLKCPHWPKGCSLWLKDGCERHMIFLVDFFDWSDNFDQMLSCTCSQEGNF
jgi:hypothetical protein